MKVLGFQEGHLREMLAYTFHQQELPEDEGLLFQAQVLAFAPGLPDPGKGPRPLRPKLAATLIDTSVGPFLTVKKYNAV